MAIERDNAAERLSRIEKLMAETKPIPAEKQPPRLQTPQQVAMQIKTSALADGRRPIA